MSEPSSPSIPNRDSASSPRETESSDEGGDLSSLPPVHQDVVRRLRKKIERAASLLDHLQAENERLRQRVEELEQRPEVSGEKTVLALDDDPAALRDRVSTFIDAIDTYLEDDASPPPPAAKEPSSEETTA